ncbi:MAG: phosphoribosylanthranilate isomerase [Acidobacteria bacterium]|nr:phosphoribosylanthranilate isomerase [Acidobacteriota bacterium]MCY3966067.1 phosphoribosylanthranilate isomerase [Acidobacteriota bacterium]
MKVKICGVTTSADALLAVDLGADFVGLNFYRPSPRWIDIAQAAAIRRAVGDRARAVGIFVNPTREELETIDRRVGLDFLQFSGDESPELVAEFSDRAIRVRRVGGAAARDAGIPDEDSWAVLIDRAHDRLYGGSGESWDYAAAAGFVSSPAAGGRPRRVFIAGGVHPGNVAQVAAAVPGAYAVDTCSGVEVSPGLKDRVKLERLFANLAQGVAR